jgi:DNA-binding phage protein
MISVASNETEVLIQELADLLNEACEQGDNVAAIAKRAGVSRPDLSRLRNMSHTHYPNVETLVRIASALGKKISIHT